MLKSKVLATALIASLLVISALCITAQAQTEGTVIIGSSVGGTTDPPAGTSTYADGTEVTFTATPDPTFVFQYWIISTDAGSNTSPENPITIPIAGGVTYTVEPVYAAVQTIPGRPLPPLATAAIVVVLAANGGTTSPAPGTYALADATQLMLTATPLSGWQFSHWVISGQPMNHGIYDFTATPSDNPYTVDHGYGNTYAYQPVFTPVGSATPTPSGATPTPGGTSGGGISTETIIIIGLVVVIIIILIAFGIYASRKK